MPSAVRRMPLKCTTLSGLLQRERDRFRQAGMADKEVARESLASVCHVLLNANEFLYVE